MNIKTSIAGLLILSNIAFANTDIILSKKIKPELKELINHDLNVLDSFPFQSEVSDKSLSILGLTQLNSRTASDWLNQRVNYVIEEKAFSLFNLLVKRVIYKADSNIQFPNADELPYALEDKAGSIFNQNLDHQGANEEKGMVVMSNIGAALYLGGKKEESVYGIKISRGLLKKAHKVELRSPRAGVIQIGEGLFANELAINPTNKKAFSNSIFRLATFFHEARHSDGNGRSLGFLHATCPLDHDYAGAPACDENLNGPYTVGKIMVEEMSKACEDSKCSLQEKEILKLLVLDNASRVLKKDRFNRPLRHWDDAPESL